jgi:CDP-2,3-bis-(O-geranylgeranyl)-sn-glycerol synthase
VWRLIQLLELLLPVYAANMAAAFARFFPRAAVPISTRWLGGHKTWLGYGFAIGAAMLVAAAQAALPWREAIVRDGPWWLVGAACGLGAMLGDTTKSFFKRRLDIAPGQRWVPADQLDFVAGGLLALRLFADFGWADVAQVMVATFFGALAVNRLAYWVGIKNTPW